VVCWSALSALLYYMYAGTPAISAGDDINSIGVADGFAANLSYFYQNANGRLGLHIVRALIAELTVKLGISPFDFPWLGFSTGSIFLLGGAIIILCYSLGRSFCCSTPLFISGAVVTAAVAVLSRPVVEMLFSVSFAGAVYAFPLFIFSIHIWLLQRDEQSRRTIFLDHLAFLCAAISSEQMWISGTLLTLCLVALRPARTRPLMRDLVTYSSVSILAGLILFTSPGQRSRAAMLANDFSIIRWLENSLSTISSFYGITKLALVLVIAVSIFLTALSIYRRLANKGSEKHCR